MPIRRPPLLVSPLLVSLLLPTPLAAQQGTGATVAPLRPGTARPAAPPRLPGLTEAIDDPATLLRLAGATLDRGRPGEALELLERAEARLLTRSELASRAAIPQERGVVGEIAAARAALGRRDREEAGFRIGQALAWLDTVAPDTAAPDTAAPVDAASPAPATQGGGQAGGFAPLPGIAPRDMPVGGTTSPPVPIGPDADQARAPTNPGDIPPSSAKAPMP